MRKRRDLVGRRGVRRKLFVERLEGRRLLVATDLASISGLVFDDFSGNGFDVGEEVAGATLVLYRDNGNGIFEPGSDTQVQTTTTGEDGRYSFDRLTTGNYFVLQDAQTVGGSALLRNDSPLISIGPVAVEGRIVLVIDDFDTTQQFVIDTTNDGIPVTSSVLAPEAIGGARDLFVNKTSEFGSVQLSVHDPLLPNLLSFDSIATGNGERRVIWDGPDFDATVIDDTGLGEVDLTSGGEALGLQLRIGADLPGGEAVVRVYSDDGNASTANRFSTATIPIPQTGGMVPFLAEFIPFSQFTATSGGGADLNRIGAIELEITGASNVNGSAELVGTVGQTLFLQDFDNFASADLSLSKTIDDATPNIGQTVTFTVTLTNDGPDSATNVAVRDQLPEGVTFVSAAPTLGNYDAITGVWTVGSIASGTNATLSMLGRIESAGTRSNVAEVIASDQFDPDSTPGNNNPLEDDQAIVTFVTESIDLSLTKSAVPTTVIIGSNVTFTLTLRNDGPSTATGVAVRDQLPDGIAFVSGVASRGSFNAETWIWDVGSVALNEAVTLNLVGRVDAAGPKTNTAEVIAADQVDVDSTPGNNDPNEDDQDSVTIEVPLIDLSLSKSANPTTVVVGQNVTFTIDLANAGPSTATGVSVRDQLPSGISFVSATPSQGAYDPATGVWTVGTLAVGVTPRLTLVGQVEVPGSKTNTAEVITADQPDIDSTPGNNDPDEDDQDSVTITPQVSDLSLLKSVDNAVANVGETVTFTVTLFNSGPDPATGVTVLDQLPAEVRFVSSLTSQGSYDAQTGLWTVGSVPVEGNPTLQIIAVIDTPGPKTNSAQVNAADQFDPNSTPGNNNPDEDDQDSVVVTPPVIDLSLTKTVNIERPAIAEIIRYTVTVSNAGPSDASGVVVADEIPDGVLFVSSSTQSGNYDPATGRWTIDQIPANTSVMLVIDVQIDTTETTTNFAEVFAADQFDIDSTPGNGPIGEDDDDSATFTPAVADLSLTKTVDFETPNVGEDVTFTIVVSNAGPDPATGVSVLDQLPAGLVFVSSTPQVGNYDPGTGIWQIGTLNVGTSTTLTLVATVTTATPVTNTAEVQTSNQIDPDSTPGNNVPGEDDQSSVIIQAQQIDLELNKRVDNDRPNVGDEIRFTIQVDNLGPSLATGVSVRDQLPTGLTFTSSDASQGGYDFATGIWTIGSIPANSSVSLDLFALVDEILSVENVAEVISADQPDVDSVPGNNNPDEDDQDSVTVTTLVADLSLSKTASNDRPNVGQQVTFTLSLRNDGPDGATNVRVRDQLPDGVSFVSSSPSQGTYDAQSGIWTVGSVARQATATLQLVALVQRVGLITNSAEVVAVDQADPNSTPDNNVPTEDDQDSVTIDPPVIDLSLTKSASPLRPRVGGPLVYTLELRNDGPDRATGIIVRDQLPPETSFVSATPSVGQFDPITGNWTVPSLAAGASATLVLNTTVNVPSQPVNRAEVIAADQFDSDSTPGNNDETEDDQDSVTVTTASADLSLTKSVDDDRPGVGSNVTFTLRVFNAGPDNADAVVVRDQLPPGMTFVSSTASLGSFEPVTGRWTIPTMVVGKAETLQIVARVDNFGERVNTAEIVESNQFDPDSTPGNNNPNEDDQDSVTLIPELVDLALAKLVDNPTPNVGDTIRFSVIVGNSGPSVATLVEVTDQIPTGLTVTAVNASQGVYDPATGLWIVGTIPVNAQSRLDIDVRVNDPAPKTNVAEVTSVRQPDVDSTPGNGDPNEDDFGQVTITPQQADLELSKSVNIPTPNQDDELLFTLVVSNKGPSNATNVAVRDLLPAGLIFLRSTVTSGNYNPTTGVWSIPMIANGSAQSLQLVAAVNTKVPVTNQAEVIASDQFDPDSTPDNQVPTEDDFAQVTVTPKLIDLSVAASINIAEPNLGQVFEMTFQVRNDGPDNATGVAARIMVPSGLTVISSRPGRGTFINGVWSIGSITRGETVQLTITARADARGTKYVPIEVISHQQADIDSDPGNNIESEDDQTTLLVLVPLYSKRLFLAG